MSTKPLNVLIIQAQGDVVQPIQPVTIPLGIKVLVLSEIPKCCSVRDIPAAIQAGEDLARGNATDDYVVTNLPNFVSTRYAKMETVSMPNNNFTFVKSWTKITLIPGNGESMDVTSLFRASFGQHMGRGTVNGEPLESGGVGDAGAPAIQLSQILSMCQGRVDRIIMVSCRRKIGGTFVARGGGGGGGGGGGAGTAVVSPAEWLCSACTFINPETVTQCKMCETERPSGGAGGGGGGGNMKKGGRKKRRRRRKRRRTTFRRRRKRRTRYKRSIRKRRKKRRTRRRH